MSHRIDGKPKQCDSHWMHAEVVTGGVRQPKWGNQRVHPEQRFRLAILVKSVHHWIRKGDGDRARKRAIECVKQIRALERRAGDCSTWGNL